MLVRDLELILDAVDEDLVQHVDSDGHLAIQTAEQLRDYAERLVEDRITFDQLAREWPDWFPLVSAFVEAYEFDDVAEMFGLAPFGEPEGRPLTPADEAFLQSLIDELTMYVDERRAGTTDF